MGRRSGSSILFAIARDVARAQRKAEAARVKAIREGERQVRIAQREAVRLERDQARTLKEIEREDKARFLQEREQERAALNEGIATTNAALESILSHTLSVNDLIAFDDLRIHENTSDFIPPTHLRATREAPKQSDYLDKVSPLQGFWSFFPGAKGRHERAIVAANRSYEQALALWRESDLRRLKQLAPLEAEHAEKIMEFESKKKQRNEEVDLFEAEYKSGKPDAIISYCTMVLERSSYPEDFPHNFSIAYTEASKQLVIEYELPPVSVVPIIAEYRYARSSDTFSSKNRKATQIRDTYQEIIASVALRTIHEIFEADQESNVQVLCFNGYIHTVDPATGRDIQPHLISVRTTNEKFSEIDLARVDKRICLRNLGAQVSRQPDEAQPVRPIVEFQMADARFVDQTDLVSGLSAATNLMDLNPHEFEQLVANLFSQMGLESKLTRSSRDGGVDCVAYDPRPVLGGKVVIQAKRYRHTVGVSAVRDLFGTMMNEGANKGILVTTSGYGPDAFDFAREKPIELIDGGGLLFLLQDIGVEARIVFPEVA